MSGIKITTRELETLIHPNFISDSIVDAVLRIFQKRHPNIEVRDFCILTSILDMKSFSISRSKDVVIFPYCSENHWRLILVFGKVYQWSCVDPKGVGEAVKNKIQQKFLDSCVSGRRGIKYEYKPVSYEEQLDNTLCGVLIIKHVYDYEHIGRNNLGPETNVLLFRDDIFKLIVWI